MRLRKGHTVDPSSLTKRVNKREDRKEKNMDDFQVYGKKKNKEKPADKAALELQYMGVETTKLAHLVSEKDKIFLNHIFECEKDIKIPIWKTTSPMVRIDCGIIVYYIIDKLAQGDRIPESLTTNEIRQYRVLLL
ncbi:hypothetical protein RHMOL_Rhmol11G0098500 [Rhododendron molle]|uniref:Uncharacterized protein n=1 Tax=Rhododendron molle TaxID=49168 RepID=A0ACC0LRY3_RHOML|nr:hypothetical protein RHMOL_Rhmol11G0098500 [Rhododendron molle]